MQQIKTPLSGNVCRPQLHITSGKDEMKAGSLISIVLIGCLIILQPSREKIVARVIEVIVDTESYVSIKLLVSLGPRRVETVLKVSRGYPCASNATRARAAETFHVKSTLKFLEVTNFFPTFFASLAFSDTMDGIARDRELEMQSIFIFIFQLSSFYNYILA